MKYLSDFFRLLFPRKCCICGAPLVEYENSICSGCLLDLPMADTTKDKNNNVEQRFYGRIPIEAATAMLVFKHENKVQTLLHQIKYAGNEEAAITMGRQLGIWITQCGRFDDVDILVPVPLHSSKERKRGYNQSLLLCQGITQTFQRPISCGNLIRIKKTDSQTNKNREERLKNMEGVFRLCDEKSFENKHILLVDDVITTGATTEACYMAMDKVEGLKISIASLAVAGNV